MHKWGALCAGLVAIVILANTACASMPQLISIQGRLTDAAGVPLTGSNNLTFLIYNAYSGGSALWTEYHNDTNNLTVTNGVFNVLLGSITALNLPFNESYWLEVIVNGETQSPRINFTASAYAFRAKVAEDVECIGCITSDNIAADSVNASELAPSYESGSAYDSRFVNEGQSDSITSEMAAFNYAGSTTKGGPANSTSYASVAGNVECIGCVNDTHISSSANISPNKINGTAWTSANDGSGSGLDADTVDGSHKGNGSTDLVTGATADSWISGNISAHNTTSGAHGGFLERTVMLDRCDFTYANRDFGGTVASAYADFNCASIVSAKATKVIVWLYVQAEADGGASTSGNLDSEIRIRKNGATNPSGRARAYGRVVATGATNVDYLSANDAIVICEMDANKIIEWSAIETSAAVGKYYAGKILGYIETD